MRRLAHTFYNLFKRYRIPAPFLLYDLHKRKEGNLCRKWRFAASIRRVYPD